MRAVQRKRIGSRPFGATRLACAPAMAMLVPEAIIFAIVAAPLAFAATMAPCRIAIRHPCGAQCSAAGSVVPRRHIGLGNASIVRRPGIPSAPIAPVSSVRRHREVAVTFDDLPAPADSVISYDPAALQAMTARLLAELKEYRIPAIGFVNEDKLDRGDFAQRVDILKMWLDAGFPLGNHTYSHADIDAMPLGAYEIDFLRGERITEPLLHARGLRERYFRYPYLDVGPTCGAARAFRQFLARQGYAVAPVTIDNQEYMFAAVYAHAMAAGDTGTADRVAASFLSYMNQVFDYFEKFSVTTLGFEPRQVLLLHADELDTDEMSDLVKMMRARGYRFVSLRDALRDPAYRRPDAYNDSVDGGVSWVEHWAYTMHANVPDGPDPPTYIQDAYNKMQ